MMFYNNNYRQFALARIKEEFSENTKFSFPDNFYGVSIGLVNGNYFEWQIAMIPPEDSRYKNYLFILRIQFPDNYPQNPPIVCFLTPIYHINVNPFIPKRPGDFPLGYTNIPILKYWNPEYTIKEVIGSVITLFYIENPDFCVMGLVDIYNEMINDVPLFEEKVKYFNKKYARPDIRYDAALDRDWDFHIYR